MFRFAVLIASLLSAAAFSPVGRMASRASSALKMNFEDEIGALPPTGFFDPLGLSKDIDEATFKQYRAAELKHGRVAMLAVTGWLAQEAGRLPGTIDLDGTTFSSIPNGVSAIGAVPSLGWLQIITLIGFWELIGWEDRKTSDEPGEFDFGIGVYNSFDEAGKIAQKTKELQNGRLAMLAIMTLITHNMAVPDEYIFTLHHF